MHAKNVQLFQLQFQPHSAPFLKLFRFRSQQGCDLCVCTGTVLVFSSTRQFPTLSFWSKRIAESRDINHV